MWHCLQKNPKTLQRQDRYLTPQFWQQMCNNAILVKINNRASRKSAIACNDIICVDLRLKIENEQ